MSAESPHHLGSQEVAYIFASRMREARSNKKAAQLSARSPEKCNEIREALAQKDRKYLEAKKNNFSFTDKALLLFKAKVKPLSGLSKQERYDMHKAAGYTDEEIDKITGKKLLFSAGIAMGLQAISLLGRGAGTVNERLVPFIDTITPNATTAAVVGSMALYTASYALFTEKNLQLTKKYGLSAHPEVTGMYFLSDKLFPDRIRDNLSRGVPLMKETVLYSLAYPLAVQGATGEPGKIIAGSIAAAGLNLLFTAGCEVWDRAKTRKETPSPVRRGRG